MATKLKIKTYTEEDVHFASIIGVDYTLCGLETAGDETLGISAGVVTTEKVRCPQCLAIVRYCQSIGINECKG